MAAEINGDAGEGRRKVGGLRVPIASNAPEGVNKNQRWCAAGDVSVNV